ncbi:unnamed protein product [Litomosoides sigmodontis]|uniref:Uncharacterized protein n=1 Tax=Litomosoides sigmodontis TaxID=42156 RepID=A0A3P6TCT6_LITSI|nr:unnamed protein product [Litomosoides sigmodontis]
MDHRHVVAVQKFVAVVVQALFVTGLGHGAVLDLLSVCDLVVLILDVASLSRAVVRVLVPVHEYTVIEHVDNEDDAQLEDLAIKISIFDIRTSEGVT